MRTTNPRADAGRLMLRLLGRRGKGGGHDMLAGGWLPAPVSEEERRVYVSLSDGAWPYSERKLTSLGFNGDFDNPEFSEAIATDGVDLMCKVGEFKGKSQEKWELAGWASDIEPAAEDKVKRLNARWNATASKAQSPTPSPAKSQPPAEATPASSIPAPPPPAPPSAATTRENAWRALYTTWSADKSEDELREFWKKTLDERGKPEDEFTAEDWAAVESAVQTPW